MRKIDIIRQLYILIMTVELFNELLQNIQQEKSFQQLYTEFYPQIIKICLHLYGNINDAEDIAQEIFVYLLSHKVKAFIENPNAWFYALCKYNGKMLFKKETPLNDNTDYIAPVKNLISLEMKIALSKLTTQEADVIILFWYYGYSLDEVAKILHKSYAAVTKQHERIKKKLKSLL